MQESNSNSKFIEPNSDSESEIPPIPQLSKSGESLSFSEDKYRTSGQYIKVSSRNEKIDEEAILQEFKNKQEDEKKRMKNLPKISKKKKIEKVTPNPSKKYELGNIKKKWKAQIDENIEKYKQYLKQQKKAYDGRQKEYLLDFYKILLDGVFELRDYGQTSPNDLTNNQKKIIAIESDVFLYLKSVVESFDRAFKEAKMNNKILNVKAKWDPLIKNCRDQTNFELRRKIIRSKIKPNNVLENNDEFLLSEEARLEEQRRKKLILAEADKNFEKPLQLSEEQISFDALPINEMPQPIESFRSMSSYEGLEKRISQEKEKLEEFREAIGDEPILKLKARIQELLTGTPSYNRIMGDFLSKFGNF